MQLEDIEPVLAKMRSDFELVSAERQRIGDWSEEDARDINKAIRLAKEARDVDMIMHWALWLSDLAHCITAFKSIAAA